MEERMELSKCCKARLILSKNGDWYCKHCGLVYHFPKKIYNIHNEEIGEWD